MFRGMRQVSLKGGLACPRDEEKPVGLRLRAFLLRKFRRIAGRDARYETPLHPAPEFRYLSTVVALGVWGRLDMAAPLSIDWVDMTEKKTAAPKKVGRPTKYNEKLADKIIQLIESGSSERQIAKMEGMPDVTTIRRWKDEHPDFCTRSARAREASAERFREEALQVARETSDFADRIAEGSSPFDGLPKGYVDAKKLLVQELNREAAIRDDSRFGDRKKVTLGGDAEAPLVVRQVREMSVEDLLSIARLNLPESED